MVRMRILVSSFKIYILASKFEISSKEFILYKNFEILIPIDTVQICSKNWDHPNVH